MKIPRNEQPNNEPADAEPTTAAPSYHDRMMNIAARQLSANAQITYNIGHRDARHAAAEIASEADARIRELEAQLADLKDFAYNRAPKIAAEQADRQTAELRAQLAEFERRVNEEMAFLSKDDLVATLLERAKVGEAQLAVLEREKKDILREWKESDRHLRDTRAERLRQAEAAEARAEAMRKALEMVEWVYDAGTGPNRECCWCRNSEDDGHKTDCARQAALNPTPTESEVKE